MKKKYKDYLILIITSIIVLAIVLLFDFPNLNTIYFIIIIGIIANIIKIEIKNK